MQLMTEKECAEFLKVARATLRVWRCRAWGPPFMKVGPGRKARVVYDRDAVERWLAQFASNGRQPIETGQGNDDGKRR